MVTTLNVHICTWNVGGTNPYQDDITPILGLDVDADLISIGFEELGDVEAWQDEVNRILAERGYYKVRVTTMKIMQQIVYIKKIHLPFLTHVETEYTKTGFGGAYGNKGGTCVRFRLYNKTVAIVNSHLSAHMENVQIRDEEYWNILSEQTFDDPLTEYLYQHDYLFWSGDLNYRIDHYNQEVRDAVGKGDFLYLLKYDQLNLEQQAGHAFIGFHEAEITFPPTYKYDPGTDTFDTSEKNRTPAWCDRVLWRIREEREEIVRALNWGGMDISSSDLSSSSCSSVLESDRESVYSSEEEVDGIIYSKADRHKKRRKKKRKEIDKDDMSRDTVLKSMRKRTATMMKKTAVYASSTGSAITRLATGNTPVKIHKTDVADPERFKDLLDTMEKDKLQEVQEKYENEVRALRYKSYPEFKQSDHKPVSAFLEVSFETVLRPLVRFDRDYYTWRHGQPLSLTLIHSNQTIPSTWDWVALVSCNWTDANKDYIKHEYVQNNKQRAVFDKNVHPGYPINLQVVYYSSKMWSWVAMADVSCIT